jgi:tRNA pseudouridine38-40 synthase
LTLEYDGSRFRGWQQQRDVRTVEGALRDALGALAEHDVRLTAAGRTDAGAHAHGQVAAVRLSRGWDPARLQAALNAHLPEDVVVVDAAFAGEGFHARHDAIRRTYRYLVLQRPVRGAVLRRHAWCVHGPLDLDAMRDAAAGLIGRHDFGAFGRSPWGGGTTVRTVHDARIDSVVVSAAGVTPIDGVCITVSADAFLRAMMRSLSGALVAVGRGTLAVSQFGALVERAPDAPRLTVAPAHGLHQWSVSYGESAAGRVLLDTHPIPGSETELRRSSLGFAA